MRVPRRSYSLTTKLHERFRVHCAELGVPMSRRASELIEADMEANKPATMAELLKDQAARITVLEQRLDAMGAAGVLMEPTLPPSKWSPE